MKKTIAFFTCSNGYGHFKRVLEVASYLHNDFTIDIFCEKYQYDKFQPDIPVNFIFYRESNIRWDKTIKSKKVDFQTYKNWIDYYGKNLHQYDYVVSDNIVGLLEHRPDTILMGSFLWKDVYNNKFGSNSISYYDEELILKHNPTIITNKYTETDSVKRYKNKLQFGFGCKHKQKITYWDHIKTVVAVHPSLNYLNSYKKTLDQIKELCKPHWEVTDDLTTTQECVYVCRPGVGMLTHCVEHNIPIIALYDLTDSNEIITLAKQVETLGIGTSHNTNNQKELLDGYFVGYKMQRFHNNRIYNKVDLEKNGYENTAKYLRNLML